MPGMITLEIVLLISYLAFYNVYKKMGMAKWINRNWSRALIVFSVTFAICMGGILTAGYFYPDSQLEYIAGGLFLGLSAGTIPHIYLSFKGRK